MSIEEWQRKWDTQWSKPLVYHSAPPELHSSDLSSPSFSSTSTSSSADSTQVEIIAPPPQIAPSKDPLSKITHPFPHSSPYFPDNYHIIVSFLLHRPPSRFVCYELHAARVSEVNPDIIAPFRVYVHEKTNNRDSQTCRYSGTLINARHLFLRLCRRRLKEGYQQIRALSHALGSRPSTNLVPSKLPSSVAEFLDRAFTEAAKWLEALIAGTVNNGVHSLAGTLSQQQLSMGQSLLREMSQPDLSYDSRMNLQQQYYSLIPHHSPKSEMSYDDLCKEVEILSTLQTMVSLSEASGPLSRGTLSETDMRYKSLQYVISPVDPKSSEYGEVRTLLNERNASHLGLIRVLRLHSRRGQAPSPTQCTRLFHGSSWSGLAGILSRGLLLPTSVLAHGGVRTDYGLLGSGIYFSSRPLLQYCTPSVHSSRSRIVLVCDVALGTSFETSSRLPKLTQAPEGFQSVHAVSRKTVPGSEFVDDEFVVYDESLQQIAYVIEFVEQEGPQCNAKLGTVSPLTEPMISKPPKTPSAEDEEEILMNYAQQEIETSGLLSPSGLIMCDGKNTRLPLGSCHVRGTLVDLVGEITVLQQYINDNNNPIEARYVFPLQEGCAVTSFEAFINDKKVVGVVRPKAAARKEYKEAVERGHGAYLMEQVEADVFSVSVGNLPPLSSVVIKLTYVCELQMQGSKIELCLPAGLAPTAAIDVTENRQLQNKTHSSLITSSSLNISISLDMPYGITDIQSVNHDARVKSVGVKGTIDIEAVASKLDVVLLIGIERPFEPRMWVEMDYKGDKACLLAFYPQFVGEGSVPIPEVTFLLDLSESMNVHLDTLRSSLAYALTSLLQVQPQSLFNVVAFGSTTDHVFLEAVPTNKANISRALLYLQHAQANFGATNLLEALQSLYEWNEFDVGSGNSRKNNNSSSGNSSLNNIVLLTDGELANQSEVVQLIRKHRHHTRLFVLGVGGTQTRSTLRALAQEGAGRAEIIQSPFAKHQKQNHAKITRQLQRMQQEAWYDIEIEWLSVSGERVSVPMHQFQAPCAISSLFENERLLVFGFIDNCFSAILRARSTRSKEVFERRVDTGIHSERHGSLLHRLCARRMIADYEGDYQYSTLLYDHERIRRQAKQKIEDMAMLYSLVSPFTSYLAIEERQPGEVAVHKDASVLLQELLSVEAVDQLPYIEWTALPASQRILADEQALLGGAKIVSAVRAGLLGKTETVLSLIQDHTGSRPQAFEPLGCEFASTLSSVCKGVLEQQLTAVKNSQSLSPARSQQDCKQILEVLQSLCTLAEAEEGAREARLHFMHLTAQCYTHLALLSTEFNTFASQAREAYQYCMSLAQAELSPTHPVRLSVALDFTIFLSDVVNDKEAAMNVGKTAFDNAISKLDCLAEESYKDSTLTMQALRDQLSRHYQEEEEDEDLDESTDEKQSHSSATYAGSFFAQEDTFVLDGESGSGKDRLTASEIEQMVSEAEKYCSRDEDYKKADVGEEGEEDEEDSLFVYRKVVYSSNSHFNCVCDLLLIDVTPLSLGFALSNGVTQVVIPRNCTIPCKKEVTVQGSQLGHQYGDTCLAIVILEGERALARDNNELDTLYLTIPSIFNPIIRVVFDLDANGILTVTAIEQYTEAKKSIVITNDAGRLSKEAIEEMVKAAEKYAREDAEQKTLLGTDAVNASAYDARIRGCRNLRLCYLPWAPEGVWGEGSWRIRARKKESVSLPLRSRRERRGPDSVKERVVFTNNLALRLAIGQHSDGSWNPVDVEVALDCPGLVRDQLALAGCLSVGNATEAANTFATALSVLLVYYSLPQHSSLASLPLHLLAYLAPLPLSFDEDSVLPSFFTSYYQRLNDFFSADLTPLELAAEVWLPCLSRGLKFLTDALQKTGWQCQHLSSLLGRGSARGTEDWIQLALRVLFSPVRFHPVPYNIPLRFVALPTSITPDISMHIREHCPNNSPSNDFGPDIIFGNSDSAWPQVEDVD